MIDKKPKLPIINILLPIVSDDECPRWRGSSPACRNCEYCCWI